MGRAYDSPSSSELARLRAFFLIRRGPSAGTAASSGEDSWLLTLVTLPPPPPCRARWSAVWMRAWRVSSSEREKRFSQPGYVHPNGFSPVCVRMCRV